MKKIAPCLLAWLALCAEARAQPPIGDQPLLAQLAADVSADHEKATEITLVGFGTRHTLSTITSQTRGIGAARRWVTEQFNALSQACGGCLELDTPTESFRGARIPTLTPVVDVVAVQRGTTDPERVVVISAHVDTLMSDFLDGASDAPGANDDGSGVSAVLEAARILSTHKFPATIVYAVLSGEEQGLYGGKVLANYAVAKGWRVEADLNNDIIGNIHGLSGVIDNTHVRVFSEGTRTNESPAQASARHNAGGELDSPSRNVARFTQRLADQYLPTFRVKLIYRPDRFRRGGDQLEMLNQGFPAIRITEATENYTRQHQTVRVEGGVQYGDLLSGVDFPYLAQVTRLNVITLAAMASAPEPPRSVNLSGAVTADTTLAWTPSPGASRYRIWWRDTTEPQWRYSRTVGEATVSKLDGVNIDDWFFGVSAIGADGFESPVAVAGVSGGFDRLAPLDPQAAAQTAAKAGRAR